MESINKLTGIQIKRAKIDLFILVYLFIFSCSCFRSQQAIMSLEWICSTTNTADFQIRLSNVGSTPFKFNALIIRGVHAPGLTTGNITWNALNDNTIPGWLGWPNNTANLPYVVATRKLNFSSSTGIFTNVTAPTIPAPPGIVVGSFRMLTTTTWLPNSDFNFVWETTSGGIVVYSNGATMTITFSADGTATPAECGSCLTFLASSAQPLNLSGPSVAITQNHCNASTVGDLVAIPLYTSPQVAEILWYDTPTGGTALSPSVLLNNGTYYASQLVNNCESLTRSATTVSLIPNTISISPINACDSYTWANNGQTYSSSGIYTGTTTDCETEAINLTITPSSTNTTPISACGSYTWANNGQTYSTSGIYTGTTTNCVTESLNVTITPSSINTTPASACDSYTWANNGQTYSTSGIYTGTTANCVTQELNLTITPTSTNTTLTSACGSYTWANNGQTYTSSGNYFGTTANCVTQALNLTITPTSINTTPVSACGSYTWANTGQTYTASGTFTGTTANCVTQELNLTVTPTSTNTTSISACDSYTWTNNGQTYSSSGIYTGTTTNCVTQALNLIIIPSSINISTVSECDTYTWSNNGQTYTTSGTFLGTTANCLTQQLNLTIIDCVSDGDGDGLTDYDESFLCTDESILDTDEDGVSDGVEVAQGSDPCDPCSPNINSTNCIIGIHIPTAFSPNNNGANENNVYQIIAGQDILEIDFKIIDRWGNIIFQSEDKNFQWDGTYNESKCNSGVYAYFVNVSYLNGKEETLRGNITIIR